jgi:hypothetical protein
VEVTGVAQLNGCSKIRYTRAAWPDLLGYHFAVPPVPLATTASCSFFHRFAFLLRSKVRPGPSVGRALAGQTVYGMVR